MNDPVVQMLVNFTDFDNPRTPKTKKMQVNYGKIIGGDLTEKVREMLDLGTQQRRLLVQALTYAGATPNPQNLIGAVNAYIPPVWQIQKSLEFSKDTRIVINSPLHFEWTSVLSNSQKLPQQLSQAQGVFVFELTFVLVVRALAHYNLARQQIERITQRETETNTPVSAEDPLVTQAFKEAIRQLKIGAGVLEFTSKEVIAQWKKPPADPLPETRPSVLAAMAHYFLCMAQRVFIARVLISKKFSLLPNLFMGLSHKYELCGAALMKEMSTSANVPMTAVDAEYIDECYFFAYFGKAMARKYSGLSLQEKVETGDLDVSGIEESFGTATGFLQLAVDDMKNKKLAKAISSPRLKMRLGSLFSQEIAIIRAAYENLKSENATIYYAIVDLDNCDLPPRSQHKFLIVMEPFVMPEVTSLSFEQIVKAPAGVDQKAFDQMPDEIKRELLEEEEKKMKEIARLEAEEAKANKKGLFGRKKGKAKKNKDKPQASQNKPSATSANSGVDLPPGMDRGVFDALPPEMQAEILKDVLTSSGMTPTAGKSSGKNKKPDAVW